MPTKNIIIDRHNFNTCNQKQSEAFPSYLATIKILAKKCEFGTLNDELIRDRIVCGIYSDRVRKQLLREAALTLSSAVMICMASEQSDKNSKLLQKETNVHYVKTGGDKSNKHKQRDWHGSKTPTEHKNSDACYNCNTVHAHYRKSCPAYGKQCQNCMCYGHYATVCRKPKSAHKTHYKPNSSKAKHSYKVNELHENESESENYFHCDIIDDPSNKEAIHIDLTMMNTKAVLTVKIDTGAKINCISKNNLKRVNKDAKINSAVKINLIAYGGQQIETVGTTTLRTIVSLSSSGLQQLLNICHDYCELHDLTFNAKKSMCMYFSIDMNKHCGLPVIYLGNSVCQFVKEVKYLGVMIHSSMKTTIDVARQTRKFYMQANLLLRNFRYCSDDVKCTLFQSYCTNMYCCQLWFNSTKSSLIKLSTSYNSVLRRLLCISKPYSASSMFVSRGIPSFAELLRKSIYRFKNRIELSSNSIITACLSPLIYISSPIRKWWSSVLYMN